MGGEPVVTERARYPFSAVVGADDVKLALQLAAIEPGIGGVLLRGEKGSAKTTLARGLAGLLPGSAPFVDLPIGATEDRVIGSLDLAEALAGREMRLRPGLLAAADGGVLYVDEVNLLPDHLVDALLDVAVSGVNRVEREGVTHAHPARFVLVGSMNPEEGELRPQLLDRFGLCADVGAPSDPAVRAEAVRRRLAFDADPVGTVGEWAEEERDLALRLDAAVRAGPAALGPDLVESVSALCASVGAEGLRADLVICRAAAALAAWEGRAETGADDVRRVAPMALAHRARRDPLDRHGLDADRLGEALDRHVGPARGAGSPEGPSADSSRADSPSSAGRPPDGRSPAPGDAERELSGSAVSDRGDAEPSGPRSSGDRSAGVAAPAPATPVVRLHAPRRAGAQASGRRSLTEGQRGRLIGDRAPGPGGPASVALGATVRAAVTRRGADGGAVVSTADIREAVREQRSGNLIILAVDASGSMGAASRMEAAKGAVVGLLVDAYQRRDRVALITFGGDEAVVVLRPTASVEVAKQRLTDLPTGGRTPLAAGIAAALEVASSPAAQAHPPLVVLVTDGRATSGPPGAEPIAAAREAAARLRRRGVPAVVIDVEDGSSRLGLAAELADAMGARTLTLEELTGSALVDAVRSAQTPA